MSRNLTDSENGKSLTMEQVIDLVRSFRNDLVKELLFREHFMEYFRNELNREVSDVKSEFIKRELKELLIQPVDLVHYSKLISHIKETNTYYRRRESFLLL